MKYILIILLFITSFLPGLSRDITLGGSDSWDKIETWNNITIYPGKNIYGNLGLRSSIYKGNNPETDLLIHFDDSLIKDSAGNYQTYSIMDTSDSIKIIGNGSGMFRGKEKPLTLSPKEGSLFSSGNLIDDFTIEFWLNPSRYSSDAVIFLYSGIFKDGKGNIIPQEVNCTLKDRKLTWNLNNFFFLGTEERISLNLTGISPVIPNVWHHHLLRFDSTTGLIEYLVDGKIEAVKYATPSGNEENEVYSPIISEIENNSLIFGKNLTGFMDEIRISKSFIESPVILRYQEARGSIVSKIIDMGREASTLDKIIIESEIPKDSAIFFYYKFSDNITDMYDEGKWIEFSPNTRFSENNKGRYIKIKLNFETDGEEVLTPEVSSIVIRYEKNLKPIAPGYLEAKGEPDGVNLSWPSMSEVDVNGYLIYYGTSKGNYLGTGAAEGDSPVFVTGKNNTNLIIHGLETGRLYHFAVAAVDDAGTDSPGFFSREATCRPLKEKDN